MNSYRFGLMTAITITLLIACGCSAQAGKEGNNMAVRTIASTTVTGNTAEGYAEFAPILGRPTDSSVTVSVIAADNGEAYVEWGLNPGNYTRKSGVVILQANVPTEIEVTGLQADKRYYYRLCTKKSGQEHYQTGKEFFFQTRRAVGSEFSFGVQSDSHPERAGKMFDAELYRRTLYNAAKAQPDFYLSLGDDFSIERLINTNNLNQANVNKVYMLQRSYLEIVGSSSALFLVNGNHEQAARYLLNETDSNAAVLAAKARTDFFPLPAPGKFYSGNAEEVRHIGLVRDYYAWTWGDALLVVVDPYWHSAIAVDNTAGKKNTVGDETDGGKAGKGKRDLWQITLGEQQYRWLEKTLRESNARWKFVFAHHVNGTGRGGIEEAGLYEWGGKDRRGQNLFDTMRPGWQYPIHDLMVKNGVTIFFQGHDHLYAQQELDGVIYQTVPCPADPTYRAFSAQAYRTGYILPNSGYLKVTVSPRQVKVDYIGAFLAADENEEKSNGMSVRSYVVAANR